MVANTESAEPSDFAEVSVSWLAAVLKPNSAGCKTSNMGTFQNAFNFNFHGVYLPVFSHLISKQEI